MTQKEIADYYSRLSNGEKGRFTAFLSMTLGGSPHTWQQKNIRVDSQYNRQTNVPYCRKGTDLNCRKRQVEDIVLKY